MYPPPPHNSISVKFRHSNVYYLSSHDLNYSGAFKPRGYFKVTRLKLPYILQDQIHEK